MNSRKLSILLAVVMLFVSTLACAFGNTDPVLDNVRTARDQDGEQPATIFSTFDTVYVVSDLRNGKLGDIVTSNWYVGNAQGWEPNSLLDSAEINVNEDPFNGTVYFYFPPGNGWSVGTYKVEVLYNGTLINTVNFTVQ